MSTNEFPKFKQRRLGFETVSIHTGWKPGDFIDLNAAVPPIILTTSFHVPNIDCNLRKPEGTPFEQCQQFQYSRFGNPNREMLEKTISALEEAKFSTVYASGIGAVGILNLIAKPGDHIVCVDDVYNGTYKFYEKVLRTHGIEVTYADLTRIENLEKNMKSNTKIVWLETPTNPLNKILDIEALCALAKKMQPTCKVVVDTSFLSPYNLRPLELGADASMCSLTKYINGHADVTMGAISTNDQDLHTQLKMLQITIGVTPSPFDCYLVMRGLKTLSCRMRQHEQSAFKVAHYLNQHVMVEKVLYPGLTTHPGHEIALKQWYGLSGMLSFYMKSNLEETVHFAKNLKYFSTSYSYGGYESLVEVPYLMSGSAFTEEELEANGINESLVRMSIGLETAEDLIKDIDKAFRAVCAKFCQGTGLP